MGAKGKVHHTPLRERRRVLISPLLGIEPVGGEPLMSVTRGQCDARPTVTFPAARHHRPLAGTKLYCLVTEVHECSQLAEGYTR